MRVVAIVGQMRSGTSLLASIVHHLGIPAATFLGAPLPPKWQFDWEDPDLSVKLMQMRGCTHAWLCQYLARRGQATRELWDSDRFAIKSPYLAMYWPRFVAACEASNADLTVLKTTRDQMAIDRSMVLAPKLNPRHQATIRSELGHIQEDMLVRFEDLIERGEDAVRDIARCLGVFANADIERAAAQVRPQEVALCR